MDLRKLNSITKYPSILTYHAMGERGKLTTEHSEDKNFSTDELLYVYEKVDGENSRIILLNSDCTADYLIGSREELLYAKGDRIGNPYGNIAEFLKPIADEFEDIYMDDQDKALTVIYQESYGGKTTMAKNYTSTKTQGYRVFDVFSLSHEELYRLLDLPLDKIAQWRDNGGQPFYNEDDKLDFIEKYDLDAAPLLDCFENDEFPQSLEDTFDYLNNFTQTKVGIDATGRSEGIIVRTKDRKMIRKIRFEDYGRTLKAIERHISIGDGFMEDKGFEIKCLNCGSTNCAMGEDGDYNYEEEWVSWGHSTECYDCGQKS